MSCIIGKTCLMSKSNTELGVTEQFRDNFPQILSKCIWGRHQLELPEQVNSNPYPQYMFTWQHGENYPKICTALYH